jgi:hypothetical protein
MYFLSCRKNPHGRGLVPVQPLRGHPDPAMSALSRWVILVHGFNNSLKKASAIWSETFKKLRSQQELAAELNAVIFFYWPGDYSRWRLSSAMNYPRTIPIAEETAGHLAAYIQRAAERRRRSGLPPLQISFVAHSLGSLVVLETIRLLLRLPRHLVAIDDVLLMAAAVPEGFCVSGESYGRRFSSKTREVALYSHEDAVLKWFFRPGQGIADRLGPNRKRAIGHTGGPSAAEDPARGRWNESHNMDIGHGHYWRHETCIAEIARVVKGGTSSGISTSASAFRPNRPYAMPEASLPSYELPESPDVPLDGIMEWSRRLPGP